jgi:hypothetical protein
MSDLHFVFKSFAGLQMTLGGPFVAWGPPI